MLLLIRKFKAKDTQSLWKAQKLFAAYSNAPETSHEEPQSMNYIINNTNTRILCRTLKAINK